MAGLGTILAAISSILLVGDSHLTGSFGAFLDESIRAWPGVGLRTVGSCGANPDWFYNDRVTPCGYFSRLPDGTAIRLRESATPRFTGLLGGGGPGGGVPGGGSGNGSADVVVVALGTNAIVGVSESELRAMVARMVGDIGNRVGTEPRLCLWVGPPTMRRFRPKSFEWIYRALDDEVGSVCTLVDSRRVTRYPEQGGDGVHYDGLGAAGQEITAGWAAAVHSLLQKRISGDPIDPTRDPVYQRQAPGR